MANSTIIGKSKKKIIKEFIKDPEIIKALDNPNLNPNQTEKYINTCIFDYGRNPFTIEEVETFITVQVHIPETWFRSKPFVKPKIEIWIISHQRHMKVDNIPKITINRNDYLSELIDKKINGRYDLGFGELNLIENVEGEFQQDYLYRRMIFEGTDLNVSKCEDV